MYRKPIELKHWGDVAVGGGLGEYLGNWILNKLKLVEGFLGEAKEKGVTAVQTWDDEDESQDGIAIGWEGGTDEGDVS